ncbi:CDGSH iron-sulfur domain-containing protein [Dehalogenimonas sp. 4OHTPN]|uniref:CDGSH iron-sulfur domain-containing protein n=1 Tax=Dehalogenimonas sp. 4OHTPN TaxID=3166643 RepID=A0AAU8GBF3_9CHLR
MNEETPIPAAPVYKIKVTANGPYIVTGGVPLLEWVICHDPDGHSHGWREGRKFEAPSAYALCRCGGSKSKPFCDGSHLSNGFDGTETASREPFAARALELAGPELTLSEVPMLCSQARFCQRAGDTWHLVRKSDDAVSKEIAIEEAAECPSGRIVLRDKSGKLLEPLLPPSIGLVEDPVKGRSGPIWVRGGVAIEAADGTVYEIRNRVTLCRCGHSNNKPFCDGRHVKVKFRSSE